MGTALLDWSAVSEEPQWDKNLKLFKAHLRFPLYWKSQFSNTSKYNWILVSDFVCGDAVETKESNLETPEQEYSENVQEVAKICV